MNTGRMILAGLKRLEDDSTRTGKEKTLEYYSKSKPFTMTLYYAYNPFLRYHIRAIPENVRGVGKDDINIETWKALTALSKRVVTGDVARRFIFSHIRSLSPEAGEVVRRVLKKNLKCGVNIKSINAVLPGLLPDSSVMKAFDYEKKYLPKEMYISQKIDGVRATYKHGSLYFGGGKKVLGVNHITDTLPLNGRYDGELSIPGMGFDAASGIIRSKAAAKPRVVYNIFDDLSNQDLPLSMRLQSVNTFPLTGVCRRIAHIPIMNIAKPEALVNSYYENARMLGFEGIMIKDAISPYVCKRSRYWLKMKPFKDGEFYVQGVFEGSGKYKGMLGGLVILVNNKKVRVGGGFSDYQREVWWYRPAKVIGCLATVKFMEYTKNGSLRHPEFKSLRYEV